jgi:hypothetical protein
MDSQPVSWRISSVFSSPALNSLKGRISPTSLHWREVFVHFFDSGRGGPAKESDFFVRNALVLRADQTEVELPKCRIPKDKAQIGLENPARNLITATWRKEITAILSGTHQDRSALLDIATYFGMHPFVGFQFAWQYVRAVFPPTVEQAWWYIQLYLPLG